MNAVDEFVVYDNIQYSKKGWIHRNRILVDGSASYISIPVRKDSDYLDVRDRYLADNWCKERKKNLNRITEAYRHAPQFASVYPIIEKSMPCGESNLFQFVFHSLTLVKEYLEIRTPLIISSTIPVDYSFRAESRVIAICKARGASTYLNPIGGVALYHKEAFKSADMDLFFLETGDVRYRQFNDGFTPSLSIIDVMMFNEKDVIRQYLDSQYVLVDNNSILSDARSGKLVDVLGCER
jgi:hypothetical protein